jgi:hypothetical protein
LGGQLKVEVRYLGYIGNMLRKREDKFELGEGASLTKLLNKLARVYGETFRREVFELGLKDLRQGLLLRLMEF